MRRKAEQLEVEARHNALFDKKLSQEEAWIRQGIKARRTRNEGRVRALKALREQYRERRNRSANARLALDGGEQSGKLVFEAEDVSLSFGEHRVINKLSTTILRGDRVGIIGPNGAGKSTLIKVLLGELQPDSGQVRRGTRQQVAYFDQQREQLDTDKSVMDNVADGSQHVLVNGRDRHVASYLRDFLFPPERLQSPVSTLSGGERNRLLLARLFAKPANLLVMDEPTNDLDVETLELLEELLMEYQGTLLLVSHDRAFLDNVITSSLVFEGEGVIGEYVGGYSDWLRQKVAADRSAGRDSDGRGREDHGQRRWRWQNPASCRTRISANWKPCRRKSSNWKQNRHSCRRPLATLVSTSSLMNRSTWYWSACRPSRRRSRSVLSAGKCWNPGWIASRCDSANAGA